jgi:hypothetical protein
MSYCPPHRRRRPSSFILGQHPALDLCEAIPCPVCFTVLISPHHKQLAYFLIFCPRKETEIMLLSRRDPIVAARLRKPSRNFEALFFIFVNATFRSRDPFRSGPYPRPCYPPIREDLSHFIKAHVTVDPTATQLYLFQTAQIRDVSTVLGDICCPNSGKFEAESLNRHSRAAWV